MRAVKYTDVLDKGNGRTFLRVQRRYPDGNHGYGAFCKSEESAAGGSTHVSPSCAIKLPYRDSQRSEVHGRPACKTRLSPGGNLGNQRLTPGKHVLAVAF